MTFNRVDSSVGIVGDSKPRSDWLPKIQWLSCSLSSHKITQNPDRNHLPRRRQQLQQVLVTHLCLTTIHHTKTPAHLTLIARSSRRLLEAVCAIFGPDLIRSHRVQINEEAKLSLLGLKMTFYNIFCMWCAMRLFQRKKKKKKCSSVLLLFYSITFHNKSSHLVFSSDAKKNHCRTPTGASDSSSHAADVRCQNMWTLSCSCFRHKWHTACLVDKSLFWEQVKTTTTAATKNNSLQWLLS